MVSYKSIAQQNNDERVGEEGMISAVAKWCEFLHGIASLENALEGIANGLDADVVVLSRVSRVHPSKYKTLQHDSHVGPSRVGMIDRSFAHAVLGTYFEKPKTGSIWFKSMLEHEMDPALLECHRRRNLKELVVIPLGVNEKSIDFVELHFSDDLKFERRALLNMVADTLARTWKNRTAGLITQLLSRSVTRLSRRNSTAPILSMENPARLSRAEYRVCLLLSRGQTFEKVQLELDICASTLRTHLKNIYAKTESGSKSELLYRLLTFAPADGGTEENVGVGYAK